MSSQPEPISAVGREALERELADLTTERAAVAATLDDPGQVGDLADSADEIQRADKLVELDDRIAGVNRRLAQGAAEGAPDTAEVGVGSTVTVRFDDGTEQTVEIGELPDATAPSLVTSDSPLGLALMGGRPGDTVAYRTPAGPSSARIVSLG
ncbi:nucleoside diphosphate kinase regulator [Streptomyces sp. SID5785]|uniref:GreA/GreB family elongation factor n=1 Tax=Streptomyces sp. SID5785 TaxID=2690309 RepID=UPI00136198B0|nr:GreA/GreB family elongation factor [Streptomyces sp. SID5785]MZD07037.1 nucleoside diphosphate kinase regulator [Streptomyces sp. SID5785]